MAAHPRQEGHLPPPKCLACSRAWWHLLMVTLGIKFQSVRKTLQNEGSQSRMNCFSVLGGTVLGGTVDRII